MSLLLLLNQEDVGVDLTVPSGQVTWTGEVPTLSVTAGVDVSVPSGQVTFDAVVPTLALVACAPGDTWYVQALAGSDGRGARDVNDSGTICGGNADGHASVWDASDPGTITDLDFLGSDDFALAAAINSSGVVCGYGYETADTSCGGFHAYHAYKWTGTTATELPPYGSDCSALALGINDAGQVVGYSFPSTPGTVRAVIWNGTTPTLLDDLATATDSRATDLNASAQVVGESSPAGFDSRAVVWDGSTSITDISGAGNEGDYVYGVNDGGEAVGTILFDGFQLAGAAWSDVTDGGTISRLETLPAIDPDAEVTVAWDISADGVIVGTVGDGTGVGIPVVWDDLGATPQRLPLLGVPPDPYAGEAYGISPSGNYIAGWNYDSDAVEQACVWVRCGVDLDMPSGRITWSGNVPDLDLGGIVWVPATASAPTQLPALLFAFWETEDIVVRLYGTGFNYDQDVTVYAADLTDELPTADGYTAGGQLLTGKSLEVISATNRTRMLADPAEWNPALFSAAFAAVIWDTGSEATSPVLGVYDFNGLRSPEGDVFHVEPGEDGWGIGVAA